MDGAGSGGSSTPLTAVYGSTKCGLRQLQSSLLKECRKSKVGVHTASPGMVLTDLLLSGSTIQNKQMFNIICELPETVARTLVPRMRVVKGSGKAINYLTPPRILLALVTAWLRRGRWFDDKGRALYAAEADRLRNWAESRTRFSFTDAMEMYTENTWEYEMLNSLPCLTSTQIICQVSICSIRLGARTKGVELLIGIRRIAYKFLRSGAPYTGVLNILLPHSARQTAPAGAMGAFSFAGL
ncbi:hypothetical protein M8C21_023220 [Ambrosia artemisiifolia]|uniref:Uncharacterized protein n=1 Tax=Ambrosia artemisiifolia TaxID=4212 RepID=A0AAD5C0D0_AMBAR|nr:hypothetical protein M8C21_023220 [Ambrosia artemisiifolia]